MFAIVIVGVCDHILEAIENRAANIGPCERLAVPLPHGVDVGVERVGGLHDRVDVGCVRAHDDRRLLWSPRPLAGRPARPE